MATNAEALKQYFADMDATEEEEAKLAGVTPDEYRELRLPPTNLNPMTDSRLVEARAARARRGQRLGPELAVSASEELKATEQPNPAEAPIPTRSASIRADAPAAVVETRPPVTADRPAGPVNTAGTQGLPAPSSIPSGAGGDDEMSSLRKQLGLQQMFEALGSAGSGKNLYTDGGVILDRMKQVQALRAKREEQSLEQQRERATWGASNRATLASALAQWKSDADKTAALEALAAGADDTKPSDFSRNVVNAVMTKPKVLGAEAGVTKTEAGTTRTLGQVATDEALRPGKVEKLRTSSDLDRARIDKIYNDMELEGTKIALDERKTIDAATKEKDPFKKLEKLNAIADKKDFGGFTTLAGDLSDLERIAPGFVTRGVVPAWLTAEQQLLGDKWPRSTNPKVIDFLAAYSKLANEERHRQYGSAQTDGELRSFMQQLNASPLSAGPAVLAKQVKRFGQAAGRVAKGRISRYNGVFGADNVNTVLAPEWKPLFAEGGVFAAQGTPFVEAPTDPATGGVKIKHSSGRTTTVDRATADRMLKDDPANFSEVK